MSWLLVALIPGLLMLATLGLDRIESSLRHAAVSAGDVTEFLAQDPTGNPDALARSGANSVARTLQRGHREPDSATGALIYRIPMTDLPTHQYRDADANPEFQQTRHMNPV